MRRERGGAMLLVMMLLTGVAVVMVATSNLTSNSLSTQQKREIERTARHAFDGVTEGIVADVQRGAITGARPFSGTFAGVGYTGTLVDNSTTNPWTWKLELTMTYRGRPNTFTRVIGKRILNPNPYTYVLFANDDLTFNAPIVTGGNAENGDIGSNGRITFNPGSAGSTVHGGLEAVYGLVGPGNVTIRGTLLSTASSVFLPSFVDANAYWNAKTKVITGLGKNSNLGNYELWYKSGDLDVDGTFTGNGTIFVNGNLYLDHNLEYGNANAHVAFVVTGNVIASLNRTKNFVGYYYAGGNFESTNLTERILDRGSIVARQIYLDARFTGTNDPFIWIYPGEARKLRLPGYWP